MINKKIFLFSLITHLYIFQGYTQTITGRVFCENNQPLDASILFKEYSDLQNTKEFVISRNGIFQKKLQLDYEKLFIEVKAEGYYELTVTIDKPEKEKTYSYNFMLIKIKEYELEEVIIRGKKRPFEIKKDTISYSVSEYIDGSERKVEEVISKLPGVDVNEQTGEIRYKGKTVETVTLDGDNLFGFNYTLGTKNINVDMVEQIEAIDNYTENPLLKGIEQGGKVSLNLKLKKG